MNNKGRIPTHIEMRDTLSPSVSTYDRRFGSIYKALKLIGFDVYEQQQIDLIDLETDMIEKYKNLRVMLGHTPSSRDIEKYSREYDYGYSMSSYEFHFGSLYNLQALCDFTPTVVGRNKTKDDLIEDLHRISEELGRTPFRNDLRYFENVASSGKYTDVFGSWSKAIQASGLKPNSDTYYSNNGVECLSYYELLFTNMLEEYDISFKKEEFYKNYLPTDKRYRFDYVIEYSGQTFFIEIFGITSRADYDERTEEKIKLCRDNNLNLIEIYPKDFTSFKSMNIHEMLMSKVDNIELSLFNEYK